MSLIINVPVLEDNNNNALISFLGDSKSNLVYINDFVEQVNKYYRSIRSRKKNIKIQDVMRKQSFTEFAIALEAGVTGTIPVTLLENAIKDDKGRIINIAELCPTVIKTKKTGRNEHRGTWLHKNLFLVMLSGVDGFIAKRVQDILIEHDVFGTRNKFSSAHKLLGDAINQNPAFPKYKDVYTNVGRVVKKHFDYEDINNVSVETLEKRKKVTEEIATLTRYGHLNDYYAVKAFVERRVIEGELV